VSWPQLFVAVMMIAGFSFQLVDRARDMSRSSNYVAAFVVVSLLFNALYVYVLHRGGFW
jgi:hypothetical protein